MHAVPDFALLIHSKAHGYYVPFVSQLTALLSMSEVLSLLENKCDKNMEFCIVLPYLPNSINCKTACSFVFTQMNLRLLIPLVLIEKKHKITAFYWTLLNIPAELRSKLSTIQLLALAKTRQLQEFPRSTEKLLHDFKAALSALKAV